MFAFYDFETTGISPAFDQPLQFAAILVDEDLREVDRRNLRCRLEPHILPAPMALAVTGVTPDVLLDTTLDTWFEFSKKIAQTITDWAPATWVGYNSIGFDENVMRQMFYQNLHPDLYLTQIDGNSRLDVLQMIMPLANSRQRHSIGRQTTWVVQRSNSTASRQPTGSPSTMLMMHWVTSGPPYTFCHCCERVHRWCMSAAFTIGTRTLSFRILSKVFQCG